MLTVQQRRGSLSDEEYLVIKAKEASLRDVYEAKAWLITAKTLFPSNFGIQFESYCMEKARRNVMEASRHLENMLYRFPGEVTVWNEVRAISEALRSEAMDEMSCFIREMFARLPIDMQHQLLLSVADRCEDILDHCRLLIVLLKRFPDCIAQQGMRLVDTLLAAEKHSKVSSPINAPRKLLVCDIVPLILNAPNVEIPVKQLHTLLHKCLEFCIGCATQMHSKDPVPGTHSPSMLGSSLSDTDGLPSSPWHHIASIMEAIGHKLEWELWDNFFNSSREVQLQRLASAYQRNIGCMEDVSSSSFRQILYCTTVIFLNSLFDYALAAEPDQIPGNSSETPGTSVILLEGFRSHVMSSSSDRPPPKRHKSDREAKASDSSYPPIVIDRSALPTAGNASQSFMAALRCWDLFQRSETLHSEFHQFCQQLKVDTWPCLQSFYADINLYKGRYLEAIQELQHLMTLPVPLIEEKCNIRLACCYFHAGDLVRSCQRVVDLAMSFDQIPLKQLQLGTLSPLVRPMRHLVFLHFCRPAVLNFCVSLLVTSLQGIALGPTARDDLALGHLLVLLQYDWPREETLFMAAIELIQQAGSFVYNLFFNYIINIDMLEEFAFLASGSMMLDLLPVSTMQIAKQRTITRGVNKGAKEDFRAAIEKQITRSSENLEPLLIQFIINEQETLFRHLL